MPKNFSDSDEATLLLSASLEETDGGTIVHDDRSYGTHWLDEEGDAAVVNDSEAEDDIVNINPDGASGKGLVTASVASSIFNLTNTVIGAGVLALPFAFHKAGLLLGAGILFFCYACTSFTAWLLVECCILSRTKNFRGIAQTAYGRGGVALTQASVFMATFFTMVSYLGIIGDMFAPVIGTWSGGTNDDYCSPWADRRFSITCGLGIVCPLSMLRSIDSLKYTSYAAIASITYLVVIVVVRSHESLSAAFDEEDVSFAEFSETIFRALPIVTLAYACQFNIFPIVGALQRPTKKRIGTVIFGSLTGCFCVYLVIAVFGYLTFYDQVKGNILLNYDPDDPYITVGRLGVGLVILFSYPLLAQACMGVVDEVLFSPDRWGFSYCRRGAIVMGVSGCQYAIALFVPDISVPLGIAGSTGSTSICFILPTLFYLKLAPNKGMTLKRFVAGFIFLLGVCFFVISTTVTLLDAAEESADDESELSFLCNTTERDLSTAAPDLAYAV